MGNLAGFNAAEVEDTQEFKPLPNGEYTAVIIESEERETKTGDGAYIAFTFQIVDGEYSGRRLWHNVTRKNKNPQAVNIGNTQLKAMCYATDVLLPEDSVSLHDIPMTIKVGVEKRKDTGEIVNRIVAWQKTGTAQATSKPATGAAAPWSKKVN